MNETYEVNQQEVFQVFLNWNTKYLESIEDFEASDDPEDWARGQTDYFFEILNNMKGEGYRD